MDFALNDDQKALQSSVREFLAQQFPIERVAKIADGDGFSREEWAEVAELGWAGVAVPEESGGLGMGFVEEMIIVEELGHALFPGPYFSTAVLALPALAAAPDLVEAVVAGKSIATLAWSGDDAPSVTAASGKLSGTGLFVPDLGVADLVVVPAGSDEDLGLWAVQRDADGVSWEELPTVDGNRRLGALTLEGAEGQPLAEGEQAEALLSQIRDRALAALAAEAVGVASAALELAVEYAKHREQFGRAIGVYQAVSHKLADAFVETESARSLAYWAGWAVANEADEAPDASAAAKAYAAEAAVDTCERAIQVHGGIGFTWEHPLHRYYKRALGIAATLGWPAEQRARVAASLLD